MKDRSLPPINGKERVFSIIITKMFILGSGKTTNLRSTERIFLQTMISIKESYSTVKNKEKASIIIKMETCIKETGN